MKLPNFRLYTTQARWSVLFSILTVGVLSALAFCTLHGLNWANKAILYNPNGGFGKFRPNLVMLLTALSVLCAIIGGLLGFNSLGEKRNEKSAFSWLGLFLSALCIPAAMTLFFLWTALNEGIVGVAAN